MAALAGSRTKAACITCGSRRRRLAALNSGRVAEVSVLTPQASSAPLCCLRHSPGLPNVRNKRGQGNRGSHDLEAEIYEFMEMSPNPTLFPSKEDLIVAGRQDLVRAIEKKKGWLAYGWNSDDDLSYGVGKTPYVGDLGSFQHKIASVTSEADSSLEADSSNIVSSSGRPMLGGKTIGGKSVSGECCGRRLIEKEAE
ncbi:hypothetical protein KSP40_PGU006511 [Platanthera guangdongensis]|uniref:Uncharacterized protein n=1 Tax=Platanthera guangdongensis TaxID=2320717 RepID=A0ABR2MXV3_9ASPA